MSEQSVDLVRRANEAWNAGDMDAWSALVAPNVIWRVMPDWPEQGPFIGRDAVLRQVRQLRESWDSDEVVPVGDLIDAGGLRVILREVFAVRGVGRRRRMLAGRDANRPVIELPSHYDQSAIAREFLFFARITLCEPV